MDNPIVEPIVYKSASDEHREPRIRFRFYSAPTTSPATIKRHQPRLGVMSSSGREQILASLAQSFAGHIGEVDQQIDERKDYGLGIGPHKEQDQLAALVERVEIENAPITHLETEIPYPGRKDRCDLVVSTDSARIPIEAKLLRFRRANGNDEPEGYAKVFSPVKPSGSLVTDSEKLRTSGFNSGGGLLGIHYSAGTEGTPANATRLAEKVTQDVSFWYGFNLETVAIEPFDQLQHEVHDSGAIIAWALPTSGGQQTGQRELY